MKNNIGSQYTKRKEDIAIEMKAALKFSKVTIALDLWQETMSNVHHLGATAHYLTKHETTGELKLNSRILKLWPMDAQLPKDAPRVNDAINEILVEYDLLQFKDDLVFVTDRGGNLVNSLDGYDRRNCLNHFINNVAKEAITRSEKVEDIKNRVVRVIKFLKCNGRSANLSHNLVSFAPTRWNSFYMVLDSFINIFDEIRAQIPSTNIPILERFNALDKTTLIHIRDFLKPFYFLTKELEYEDEVTVTKILPSFELITSHLIADASDSKEVKEMKKNASKYFDQNGKNTFPLNFELWAFFDPRFRFLNSFKTINSVDIINRIKTETEIHFGRQTSAADVNNNSLIEKKEKTHSEKSSVFDQFADSVLTINDISEVKCEMDYYLKIPYNSKESVLEFWSKNQNQLPKLFNFFCNIAAIPATSASVERMFSRCGNIVTEKRNCLANESIDMLAFLNKNLEI